MRERAAWTAEARAVRTALLRAANPDGGLGAKVGLPSATEPTAAAIFALSHESDAPSTAGLRGWMRRQQTAHGGWAPVAGLPQPNWVTALAVLALARYPEEEAHVTAGASWLLQDRGRTIEPQGLLARLIRGRRPVELDGAIVGWPWVADTFSWVEPTCYAMLALQAVTPRSEAATTRIEAGERLLRDRVCRDGGWNYGNSRVLGEELWSYPDTTALALLALRDYSDGTIRRGVQALRAMLEQNSSGLATSLGILALETHGEDVATLRARLMSRFVTTGFLGDTRALAWALLASNRTALPFGTRDA